MTGRDTLRDAVVAARSTLRRARNHALTRPLVEALDRFWWARTIRRSHLVDLDVARMQGGYRSRRAAVRAYVRGGFRRGMVINPLLSEELVAGQFSDVGRVPALYAYLVNDATRIRLSVSWSPDRGVREEDPGSSPARPLEEAWREGRSGGRMALGTDGLRRDIPWSDILLAARAAADRRRFVQLQSAGDAPFTLVFEVGDREDDLAYMLDQVVTLVADTSARVIFAHRGTSFSAWLDTTLLALWLPGVEVVRWDPDVVDEARTYAPVVVRGAGAEVTAADLGALADAAHTRECAPLWLAPDGTIVSAGVVFDGGERVHLLAGHPSEDASVLPESTEVAQIVGTTYGAPRTGHVGSAPTTLTRVRVFAPGQPPAEAPPGRHPTGPDVRSLLAPAFVLGRRGQAGPALIRTSSEHTLADGTVVPRLRWAIKTAAPAGRNAEYWGDTHFARGIAAALRRLGQEVVVDSYAARARRSAYLDDVELALRGPEPFDAPRAPHSILWIISHPDEVTHQEVAAFDHVFAASHSWAESATRSFGRRIEPLLQCTDPRRFAPSGIARTSEIVFVGTARGIIRPSVVEPIRAGIPVSVYGPDWTGYIPAANVRSRSIPNDLLPRVYESAGVVLNDHWPAMKRAGFVSNRLFDVVAAGGRAVSDEVAGITDLFGGAVVTYQRIPELLSILREDLSTVFPNAERLAAISESIRRDHSFDARASEMLSRVLER
ncbi:hypothetical protein RYJ27_08850 [Microbacterium limosum]|uniref:Spore protein YkvP/CgeB glycosyl transferase-like domain-containing protein n=1 Tax=Microbacterium limosum TaxID=3079935 RepID=A0AAU0MFM4_9MICO|nr:glycosyltransferase [Microbacterium sp. Y20]WOQ68817.1 hypothetical protein RYJ27_08850 [Microbacterium sp. Y20]